MVKVKEELYGKTIGAIDCPACTTETPLKVNRNGRVFYRCDAQTGRQIKGSNKAGRLIGERCYERHFYSQRASDEILNDFLNVQQSQEGLKNDPATEDKIPKQQPEPTGGNIERPKPEPPSNGGGIVRTLDRFIFGD